MGFADIDGVTIHYHAPRDPGNRRGQCVLYVHGTGCNGHVWDAHLAAIADTHTPVALDLPGHGRSGGRGFRGMADYTHVVMELGRVLGWDRFVIVGHSMGGGIAITAGIYYPERLAGLVLVDTGARLRVSPDILSAARLAAGGGPASPTDRSWGFAAGTAQTVVDAVNGLTADTDSRVTYGDWIADDTFDTMNRVRDIRIPTLAVCGAEDRLTPVKYHRYLEEQIADCRLAVIEHAGHWVYREQPEAFTRVVRGFLDGLPPGGASARRSR
jgi:pimeloyl-ACP methyl ester carboxylesterase